jgi:hypothetical protein
MNWPSPGAWWRSTNPRSFASSHTGNRGHEVRHASSTSEYGRGLEPSHSRRSRMRLSTVSVIDVNHGTFVSAIEALSTRYSRRKDGG